jgi:hypothetical protein
MMDADSHLSIILPVSLSFYRNTRFGAVGVLVGNPAPELLKPISILKMIGSCGGVQYVMIADTSATGKVRCGIFAMLERFTEAEI